jgi:DHA1 family bicyclomycin/chloramphenicol resistance-like MFS transporter
VLSTLMVVMAVAPLVGPIVGGQVAAMAGWRAIFWLQVGIGLFNLAALYTLPETLPVAQRHDGRLLDVLGHYARLVREPRLMAYAAAGGFFYVGMFAYVAGTPFAYITYHHVPPQLYGLLFGVGIVGIMGSNAINARLVARHDSDTLLLWGTTLAAVAGVGSAVAAYWDLGGLWGLFFTLFLFVASTGFIVANSIAGALSDYPGQAGAVSALVGAFQYGSGVFGSGLVGLFADGTPRPLGFIMALAGVGACVGAAMLTRVPRAVRLAA